MDVGRESPQRERVNAWVPTQPRCIPCTNDQIEIYDRTLSVV